MPPCFKSNFFKVRFLKVHLTSSEEKALYNSVCKCFYLEIVELCQSGHNFKRGTQLSGFRLYTGEKNCADSWSIWHCFSGQTLHYIKISSLVWLFAVKIAVSQCSQWPQMSQGTMQVQWVTKYLQETEMTQLV